jgi:hypothetical protein
MKMIKKFFRGMFVLTLLVAFSGSVFAASPPSQVMDVTVRLVGEDSVQLEWEEAFSEEGVIIGYKIYYGSSSVKEVGDSYDDEIEVEAQTTYPIENLTPGKTYYFAITALDDEMNESSNYSEEIFIEIPAIEGEDPVADPIEDPIDPASDPVDGLIENPINDPDNQNQENGNQGGEENNNQQDNNDDELLDLEKPAAPLDIQVPADVRNLMVDKSGLKNNGSISLSWQKSANLDDDVVDQIIYIKKGMGNWNDGYSIGKDLEQMTLEVENNQNYEIKIVTVDLSGNRSVGESIIFSTEILATSGPGILITLSIVAIVMFLFLSFRRKRT